MAFITIDDIKAELNIDSTRDDFLLNTIVGAVLKLWDELTNRTWAKTAHTEYYDSPRYNSTVFLKNYPVDSSETIQLWDDPDWEWGDNSEIDSDDFRVDYENGIIHYNGYFYEGKQSIKVTYTAGYSDETAPGWLKDILVRQVAHWFEQAKNKSWHISSLATGEGGTTSYKNLRDNLLPEFVLLADLNRRRGN